MAGDADGTAARVDPDGSAAGRRYVTEVRVRWSDLDAYGHVNNARTLTLLEEARVDWLFVSAKNDGLTHLTDGIVVASVTVNYRRTIMFADEVEVSMGITALGTASFTVDYEVRANGILAVDATTVLVPVDATTFRPRRLSDAEHAYLATFLPAAR